MDGSDNMLSKTARLVKKMGIDFFIANFPVSDQLSTGVHPKPGWDPTKRIAELENFTFFTGNHGFF
jgi:hypothetical protein